MQISHRIMFISCASLSVQVLAMTACSSDWHWVYVLTMDNDMLALFVQFELALYFFLAFDLLVRFLTRTERIWKWLSLDYTWADLLCCLGVAYAIPLSSAQLQQTVASLSSDYVWTGPIFDIYLLMGVLRVFRLRTAVTALDKVNRGDRIKFLGGFCSVGSKSVGLFLFVVNLVLFLFLNTCMLTFLEFPCDRFYPSDECEPQLQSLFYCFWLIVCTVSTVGYGDITPATWWGKLWIILVIFGAVAFIPIQVDRFLQRLQSDEESKGEDQQEATKGKEDAEKDPGKLEKVGEEVDNVPAAQGRPGEVSPPESKRASGDGAGQKDKNIHSCI